MVEVLELRKVTVEEGRELQAHYLCAECKAGLQVAWGGYWGYSGYILRCGMNVAHQGIVKPGRASREALPTYLRNVIEKKERSAMTEQYGEGVGSVVAKYQASTSLTQFQAAEIIKSFWPKAPEREVIKAAMTCATYGLNPCMRHLYLVPYENKKTGVTSWVQTLGIGATRLMASRRGPIGYKDGPRLMTNEEQKTIRGTTEEEKYWALCQVQDQFGLTATGYGSYEIHDPYLKGRDKGNTEQNMAFIRAERNALEKKAPGEMPSNIEVMDEAYLGNGALAGKDDDVIEGEAKEIDEEDIPPIEDSPAKKVAKPKKEDASKILADIRRLMGSLEMDELGEEFVKFLKDKLHVGVLEELSAQQAKELLGALQDKFTAKVRENADKTASEGELPF